MPNFTFIEISTCYDYIGIAVGINHYMFIALVFYIIKFWLLKRKLLKVISGYDAGDASTEKLKKLYDLVTEDKRMKRKLQKLFKEQITYNAIKYSLSSRIYVFLNIAAISILVSLLFLIYYFLKFGQGKIDDFKLFLVNLGYMVSVSLFVCILAIYEFLIKKKINQEIFLTFPQ